MSARIRFLCLAIVFGAWSAPAFASDCSTKINTCIDPDALWARPGPSDFASILGARTLPAREFGYGVVTSYQFGPIVLARSANSPGGATTTYAVADQLTTHFLFAYGVLDRLSVDLALPVTFFETGSGVSTLTGATTALPSTVVDDMRLGATFAILPLPRKFDAGFGLVGRLEFDLPTGETDTFSGDRNLVISPSIAFEEHIWQLEFSGEVGARLRTKDVPFLDKTFGSQGYFALGAAFTFLPKEHLALTGEVFAVPSFAADRPNPMQWLGGVRWSQLLSGDFTMAANFGTGMHPDGELTDPKWRLILSLRYEPLAIDSDGDGVPDRLDKCPFERGPKENGGCPDTDADGDGVPDRLDKCPNQAGVASNDGCPEPDADGDGIPDRLDKCPNQAGVASNDGCPEKIGPLCADGSHAKGPAFVCDSDGDGIPDDVDKCPLEPEDKDGIMDNDGCPEIDADEDGVPDVDDKCPLVPETINGVADDDGCPEEGAHSLVSYNAGAIEVESPISFSRGFDTVTPKMRAQLYMIAQKLGGLVDRKVQKIIIIAYPDDDKNADASQKLALKRAEAIAEVLEKVNFPSTLIEVRAQAFGDLPQGKPNYLVTVRLAKPPSKP